MTHMNQAFHLYRLQQIDTQINQVDARLADIDRILAGDESVRQARENAGERHKAFLLAQQALRSAEESVREQNTKIEQAESTLYGGKVRNPKELQDLQKDIASLKKHLAHLEDVQLERMMALEQAEQAEQQAQRELAQATATFTEKSATLLSQRDVHARNRDRLNTERSAALGLITPDSLQLYDRLRQRKSGVAVTIVRDGSCAVCGSTIRPGEVQTMRAAQELVFCSSCGRIVYTG